MTLVLANSGWLNPFQKLPEHLQQGTQFATNALSLMIMMKNRYKRHTSIQQTAVIVSSPIAKAEVASGASENLASNDWCQITKAVKFNEDPFFFAGLYAALYVARMLQYHFTGYSVRVQGTTGSDFWGDKLRYNILPCLNESWGQVFGT